MTTAKIAVIGAGTVGCYLANLFLNEGIDFVLIDCAAFVHTKKFNAYSDVEFLDKTFLSAEKGRKFGLGGTSQIWGAAMLAMKQQDRIPHHLGWHNGWPEYYSKISEVNFDVDSFFKLPSTVKEIINTSDGNHTREIRWPHFKSRNSFHNLKNRRDREYRLIKNAFVMDIIHAEDRYSVIYKDEKDAEHILTFDNIFVCCGAIENTRLALKMQKNNTNVNPYLGTFLQDHLSLEIAEVEGSELSTLFDLYSMQVNQNGMISRRVEPSVDFCSKYQIPSGFLYLEPVVKNDQSFQYFRSFLQAIQSHDLISVTKNLKFLLDPLFCAYFVYQLLLKKKIYRGDLNKVRIKYIFEQAPNKQNYLKVTNDGKILINWSMRNEDFENMKKIRKCASSLLDLAIPSLNLSIKFTNTLEIADNIEHVYHPVGTMSFSSIKGTQPVTNSDLEIQGFPNVHFLSTAIFPSSSGTNPTYTLLIIATYLFKKMIKVYREEHKY